RVYLARSAKTKWIPVRICELDVQSQRGNTVAKRLDSNVGVQDLSCVFVSWMFTSREATSSLKAALQHRSSRVETLPCDVGRISNPIREHFYVPRQGGTGRIGLIRDRLKWRISDGERCVTPRGALIHERRLRTKMDDAPCGRTDAEDVRCDDDEPDG